MSSQNDADLADAVAEYYDDPLGFVLFAFPWGEVGTSLEGEDGPDVNQREFLRSLGEEVRKRGFDGKLPVMPILMSESSGHGTGKSAKGAWLTCWIMSTRPHSLGTITAGNYQQLEERTWAACKHWLKLCITSHWFTIQAAGAFAKSSPSTWKVQIQSCKEENAQSFAGQHARSSTSWYLFDEASEVPDKVWEVASGGLTDGEPMMFAWGQPVRNSGMFYRVCFGDRSARWNHRRVDSRTSKLTNKPYIEQLIEDYGLDSDYIRVRVLGQPPNADELQFIDSLRVKAAQKREVYTLDEEPLIVGFDVSGGGSAWNVMYFRRGADGRSIPRVRISGEQGRDRAVLIGKAAEILRDRRPGLHVAAMFVDQAFGSPIVVALQNLGFQNVFEVNFGGSSPDSHQLNHRSYMYNRTKEWLLTGGIPADESLALQLTRPGYHIRNGKLVLESKADMQKRGEASPDDSDALALTFATDVAPISQHQIRARSRAYSGGGNTDL